ncbi:NAD-dependent epimerase/dehydratase family protein [Halobacillus salinus]|uniref:NAD-dependent epimerase/dehydratase family protein n=1 Tax=Halobacillus salinus TaxID=192814 RepID=A0A4Z0H3J2_9BACI|nr:NAD-dependent epimerase/dehydratase family protein [Halobacillus salinus]TGB04973.1 NAD-dependent epimerase/dehydratase family protein [Halobacillus salinus]
MKLLLIGGTQFLGRHIVDAAKVAGHEVTLFNRGKTNPSLHQNVKVIQGDREVQEDIDQLKEGTWDAVIDTCGYTPQTVAKTLDAVSCRVDHYVFISTVSVYKDLLNGEGLKETADVLSLSSREIEEVTSGTSGRVDGGYYGPLKYHCEEEVLRAFREQHTIIRPGLIVGPHDPTDRFTYWPSRIAKGGEVLSPEPKHKDVQLIDARDLAEWAVHVATERIVGTFNASGPGEEMTMEDFLESCKKTLNEEAKLRWVPNTWLADRVQPWLEMPLWIGQETGFGVDSQPAVERGLSYRPIEETIRDTYDWHLSRGSVQQKAGLDEEKEKELLKDAPSGDQ